MQTSDRRRLSKCALCGACVLACGGFEPDFAPQPAPAASAGLAGWSYDAGIDSEDLTEPDGTATLPASGGSTSKPPVHTVPNEAHAGEGGEATQSAAGEGGDGPLGGSGGHAASAASGGSAALAGTGTSVGGQSAGAGGAGGAGSGFAGSSAGGAPGSAGSHAGGSGGSPAGGAPGSGGAPAGGSHGGAAEGGAAGAGTLEHALFFSEYVETSSSFKALEIRAERASTLDGCRVAIYSNGSASISKSIGLGGALATHDVYLLCSPALGEELGATCDATSGNLNFNGNDAIVLECDGAPIDSMGQVGFDPGVAWQGGDTATADQTLLRRCTVTEGDRVTDDPFDPSLEWSTFPDNTFTGLGDGACE